MIPTHIVSKEALPYITARLEEIQLERDSEAAALAPTPEAEASKGSGTVPSACSGVAHFLAVPIIVPPAEQRDPWPFTSVQRAYALERLSAIRGKTEHAEAILSRSRPAIWMSEDQRAEYGLLLEAAIRTACQTNMRLPLYACVLRGSALKELVHLVALIQKQYQAFYQTAPKIYLDFYQLSRLVTTLSSSSRTFDDCMRTNGVAL
ncbi:hypothetical protein BD413DRAFT_134709 [Trametes elegans]|nr:hypothetical protein BD413DRAFT_134709 [Trametes elegans]